MAKILVLNGPNLNLLGTREPEVYGKLTLGDIEARLKQIATNSGHELESFQSNAESALIERIHSAAREGIKFILINPAAFTHTSVPTPRGHGTSSSASLRPTTCATSPQPPPSLPCPISRLHHPANTASSPATLRSLAHVSITCTNQPE
jgi:hypothetical protein